MPVDATRLDRRALFIRVTVCLALLAVCASCATRVLPPLPTVLAHPEFVYPRVPGTLEASPGASRIDVGWRYLQANDLKNAELEFGVALKLGPRLYPARAGQGYAAMAGGEYVRALTAFDAALQADSRYVPALVGRGQALLALGRTTLALASFEAALVEDPSLAEVGRRVEVLRFRNLQDLIDTARAAAAAGRLEEARRAYDEALADSPETAFLHRELGLLEKRSGDQDRALDHLRQAVALDPSDAAALVAEGELLEARGNASAAEAAYRQAAAADPSLDLGARIAAASTRAREAGLPPQFGAALTAPQITRGDLAALVAVRLGELLRAAPGRQVVMTDTQGHWAANWIAEVASAGVIEPFENHAFQPDTPIRRGDLAVVVSHLVALVEAVEPTAGARVIQTPVITDIDPGHVQYDAVVSAVTSGVMPLAEGGRFQVARQISGAEAVDVIGRVRALAATLPGAARP